MNKNVMSTQVTLLAKLLIIFMILIVIFTILTTITSARMEGSGNIIFGDTISGPVGISEAFSKVYYVDGNLWIDSDGSNHVF